MPEIDASFFHGADGAVDAGPVKVLYAEIRFFRKSKILMAENQPCVIVHVMIDKMVVSLWDTDVLDGIVIGLNRKNVHEGVLSDHGPVSLKIAYNAYNLNIFVHSSRRAPRLRPMLRGSAPIIYSTLFFRRCLGLCLILEQRTIQRIGSQRNGY